MHFDFSLEPRPELSQSWDAATFAKAVFIKVILTEFLSTTAAGPLLNDATLTFGQSRLVRRFNLSCTRGLPCLVEH
jgi:hypothetical protein